MRPDVRDLRASCPEPAPSFSVREALPGDALAWQAHTSRVLQETPWLVQAPEDPAPGVESLGRMLLDYSLRPASLALVAERRVGRRSRILGTLTLAGGRTSRIAHAAELSMSVVREAWGQGVGTALLKEALRKADEDAALTRVSLCVVASNAAAIRLYERHGFVREGLFARYVRLGPEVYDDLIPMSRPAGGRRAG
jgi:RimJ/RimL family protein N-acetyltransferase